MGDACVAPTMAGIVPQHAPLTNDHIWSYYGHIMITRTVRIAELKARLSERLREVRRGRTLTVLDRDTPIARIVPYSAEGESLVVREPLGRSGSLQKVPLPPPLKLDIDIVDLLLEERQGER